MSATDQSLDLALASASTPGRPPAAQLRPVPLDSVDRDQWEALASRRLEGNGFFDPGFSRPAFGLVGGATALRATSACGALSGLLPVISAWRAMRLPLPMLVARQPYSVLSTPLLDAADPVAAAMALLDGAAAAGAAVLMVPDLPLDGPVAGALAEAIAQRGVASRTDTVRHRAMLDATVDAETYLRTGMGAKKLKELRRQSHRMADEGDVRWMELATPTSIAAALDRFLLLEASGWKGRRGTGLGQSADEAAFIRSAALDLGARGNFSVLELWLGKEVIASGTLVRQGDHALFFKIAYDESYSRFSPGVQLTVELTRRLCADPAIRFVDSSADAGHPMIDHVWRERLRIGDLFIPTGRSAPLAAATINLAMLRRRLRQRAKSFYHRIRSFREKRP